MRSWARARRGAPLLGEGGAAPAPVSSAHASPTHSLRRSPLGRRSRGPSTIAGLAGVVVVAVVAAGILLVAAGCGSAALSPSASGSPAPAGSPVGVSAASLSRAFASHPVKAAGTYKGKVIALNGVVTKVDTDPLFQAPEVVLAGSSAKGARTVDCVFETRYSSTLQPVRVGQTLSLRGTCEGLAGDVLFLHCRPLP